MNNTKVVNIRFEECDVRVDRSSKWGNPFIIGKDGTREEVIAKYKRYLANNEKLASEIGELKGKKIGCWCKPQACHGDVLASIANRIK